MPVDAPAPPRPATAGWLRAFWRWHFYAAFLVVPFLLMLSVTGLIYLLRFQLEPLLHPDLMRVEVPAGAELRQPYAAQLDVAQQARPGWSVVSMTEPAAADHATRFSATTTTGATRDVFVDPWTSTVLGDLDPDATLSGVAIRLHGDLMVGPWGDAAIELAACWSVVMAITGYLLFVRGRAGRLRRVAARARGARLRQVHAWVGAVSGAGLVLLVVTGLPWTGVWGEQVQRWATGNGTSLWGEDPGATSDPSSTLAESLPGSRTLEVPWALGTQPVPVSTGGGARVADLDTALAVGTREGLRHPITVALPDGDEGVYSAIGYAFTDPGQERTVHVDRFSGQALSTYGYADYPRLAKVVAQGIAVHEGRRFGSANFWATLLFCVAVIVLCLTGPVMWWRRRPPAGGLAAPRGRLPIRRSWPIAVLLVALGLALPLFGASLVVVLLLDRLVVRRSDRLRQALGAMP